MIKRLINHSIRSDVTGQYLVMDIDSLRTHMNNISKGFLILLGITTNKKTKPFIPSDEQSTEVIQLQLPLL